MLDLLDKKILNELNADLRASYSSIAKKVRSSKEVVSYRIAKLQEKGVIDSFVTVFGFGYWSYKLLLRFEKISNEQERFVIDYLTRHDNTTWVTPCLGGWDLVFVIMAKDPRHFAKILREVLAQIGEYLQDYTSAVSTGSDTFGHTYLLGSVKKSKLIERNVMGTYDFDEKDKELAKLLRKNARMRLVELSRATGIAVDTVKYRLQRMEQNNIIKRYRLILDPTRLGYMRYEIFLRCIKLDERTIMKLRSYCEQNPHVEYFSNCVGGWDIELTVHFKDILELREFVMDVKKQFGEYINNFESISLFQTQEYVYFPEELK